MTIRLRIKRVIDLGGAAVVILATAPFLALSAFAIRIFLGAPVLFSQDRGGHGGRIFRVFKLRTMTNAFDRDGRLLPDEQRQHPVGTLIRRLSLDELPQLWNVLRGEMSLVGPRPLLVKYLPRYTPFQMRRHLVLPGITGLSQVAGRNSLDWDTKFELDVWYVDHWSLALDFSILFRTIWKVLAAADTTARGRFTEHEFMGSEPAQAPSQSPIASITRS